MTIQVANLQSVVSLSCLWAEKLHFLFLTQAAREDKDVLALTVPF